MHKFTFRNVGIFAPGWWVGCSCGVRPATGVRALSIREARARHARHVADAEQGVRLPW